MRKRIAILGATSHIAKGLIANLVYSQDALLILFARRPDAVRTFLDTVPSPERPLIKTFNEFESDSYDVIINCVGIGEPQKLRENFSTIFSLTEYFDNLVLEHLAKNPDTLYINFSSGAAFGTDFSQPVKLDSYSSWDINNLNDEDYYGIAKLHSEAKHRSFKKNNIVDLRVFGYFSRFINLESKYLLTEIISCIKQGKEFITGPADIVREYVHPRDLTSLVMQCMKKHSINDVFDVYSRKPVTKFELLDYFKSAYNLQFRINKDFQPSTITGAKDNYYSNNKKAEILGFRPTFTSLDCIVAETKHILDT